MATCWWEWNGARGLTPPFFSRPSQNFLWGWGGAPVGAPAGHPAQVRTKGLGWPWEGNPTQLFLGCPKISCRGPFGGLPPPTSIDLHQKFLWGARAPRLLGRPARLRMAILGRFRGVTTPTFFRTPPKVLVGVGGIPGGRPFWAPRASKSGGFGVAMGRRVNPPTFFEATPSYCRGSRVPPHVGTLTRVRMASLGVAGG